MVPYTRTVHFQDTDAAGVVFFANVLGICHEAYEHSLQSVVNLKDFFSSTNSYAIPIVHASVDFFSPIFCGDRLAITLEPQILSEHAFLINYKITNLESTITLCQAQTKHVCINTATRTKLILPTEIKQWLRINNEGSQVS